MSNTYQQLEILIVDDNFDDADLVMRALKKHNFVNHIVHLKDGADAIDYIYGLGKYSQRNTESLPQVIFLDMKMPKVGGLEVLAKLKSDPDKRRIPIVILTSTAEDPDIRKAYDLGANSFIVKPIEFENFAKTVSELGYYWLAFNKI